MYPLTKDIKHIRQDFHSAAWVMPRCGTWGTMGVWGSNFFPRNSTRFGVWAIYTNGTCTGTIFRVPAPWGLGEGSKFKFFNMVMWYIKLKEISSRPGYTEKVKPTIKLETLGWGQRVNYHLISSTLLKKSNGLLIAYRTWWYWAVYIVFPLASFSMAQRHALFL